MAFKLVPCCNIAAPSLAVDNSLLSSLEKTVFEFEINTKLTFTYFYYTPQNTLTIHQWDLPSSCILIKIVGDRTLVGESIPEIMLHFLPLARFDAPMRFRNVYSRVFVEHVFEELDVSVVCTVERSPGPSWLSLIWSLILKYQSHLASKEQNIPNSSAPTHMSRTESSPHVASFESSTSLLADFLGSSCAQITSRTIRTEFRRHQPSAPNAVYPDSV